MNTATKTSVYIVVSWLDNKFSATDASQSV